MLFGKGLKKKRKPNQFQLPQSANVPPTWNKGGSIIIYIKREPGAEDEQASKRPRFQKVTSLIKSRISTDDLICYLENNPRLAKSRGLFT